MPALFAARGTRTGGCQVRRPDTQPHPPTPASPRACTRTGRVPHRVHPPSPAARREVLGAQTATSETGPAWNTFLADLTARGLTGVQLVTSDAHAGLKDAIAANLPGTVWQRCRTHNAANLMSTTPRAMWPAVKVMLHSVYDQPTAEGVNAQFDRTLNYVTERVPAVAAPTPSGFSPTATASSGSTCDRGNPHRVGGHRHVRSPRRP